MKALAGFCFSQGRVDSDALVEDEAFTVPVIATDLLEVFQDAAIELPDLLEALAFEKRRRLFATDAAGAEADDRLVFQFDGQPAHGLREVAEMVHAGGPPTITFTPRGLPWETALAW